LNKVPNNHIHTCTLLLKTNNILHAPHFILYSIIHSALVCKTCCSIFLLSQMCLFSFCSQPFFVSSKCCSIFTKLISLYNQFTCNVSCIAQIIVSELFDPLSWIFYFFQWIFSCMLACLFYIFSFVENLLWKQLFLVLCFSMPLYSKQLLCRSKNHDSGPSNPIPRRMVELPW